MTDPAALKPWQWPECHWRQRVAKVRAGRTLAPAWPDGKRCAVALSFDVDHETNELPTAASPSGARPGASTGIARACRGPRGAGLHAHDEHLDLASLGPRIAVVANLLGRVEG